MTVMETASLMKTVVVNAADQQLLMNVIYVVAMDLHVHLLLISLLISLQVGTGYPLT